MYRVEMVVAISIVIVSYHLFRLAFETHTFLASTTSDSVASINTIHWNSTFFIGILPNSILFHIFFECFISAALGFLTCDSRMILILNYS